jgi:hypothetical protein
MRVELAPLRHVWFCLGVALTASSCATQREQRLSSAESRDRPTDERCEPQGKPPTPTAEWACPYWHWNGVKYVWVEGNWEKR